jgi:hypothetical protein
MERAHVALRLAFIGLGAWGLVTILETAAMLLTGFGRDDFARPAPGALMLIWAASAWMLHRRLAR